MYAYIAVLAVVLCATLQVDAGKLGYAWDGKGTASLWNAGKVSWYYNWDSFPQSGASKEYVPMMWGPTHASVFNSNVNKGLFNSSAYLLGFNEPDQSGQSNLTPAQGVTYWKQYMQPLASKFQLGAPAVSSAPAGKQWLTNFFAQCTGCSVSFIPIHWYGSDPNAFTAYVADIYNTFKKPIWVTEWACVYYGSGPQCDQNSVYSFMGQTTSWLDQQSYVQRFSWFGARVSGIPDADALLTTAGTALTGLGSQYVTVGGHS